jgi:hypothetical protein
MTDSEMAEARRLVKFGIEQGWISPPAGAATMEWWQRPTAKPEDAPVGGGFNAGRAGDRVGKLQA